MTDIKTLLVGLIAAASVAAADGPPPFGTVVQQWNLPMSGSYAGAGITWRRDSGLLYLLDGGSSGGGPCVWTLDPADPTGTIRRDSWVFANLGWSAPDIYMNMVWDPDSGCFWISQVPDGSTYNGCYLVRMAWSDSAWRWPGTPADSWWLPHGTTTYLVSQIAKRQELGYFIGAIDSIGGLFKFDPYTKTILGHICPATGYHGLTLVPADSFYIITSADPNLLELDSTGQLLLQAPAGTGPADMELVIPSHPAPDDTVFAYVICSDSNNTLLKISVGMLWGQINPGQAIGEPGWPVPVADGRLRVEPNPCRGYATVRIHSPLPTPYSLTLSDITGRTLQPSIYNLQSGMTLDLRALRAGVYVLRLSGGTFTCSEKLVLQH
jgi:hypothetical protein